MTPPAPDAALSNGLQRPRDLERAPGTLVGPGTTRQGGVSRPLQGTCASPQGRGCLPGGAEEARRDVSTQDAPPPPLTAASETARPHLDHWASSAASLRASSGDCCIGQHCRGAASPEPGSRPAGSRLTRAAPPKSTCQSQRRFRPALPGRVAPGRPRRAQCGRQAGRASWSPPSRRPSGRSGRAPAPGSAARSGASRCFLASGGTGRPCSAKTGETWRGGSEG